jgi:PAS domain S-box-containing protein
MENRLLEAASNNPAHRVPEEELQFRSLADGAPFMIWRSDTNRRCDYFNRAWLEFTGRGLQQEMGLGWTRGLRPDDYQRCLDLFQRSLAGSAPFTMDYHLRRHDGTYRWILSNGVPYRRGDALIGFLGSCVDISDYDLGNAASDPDGERRLANLRDINHRVNNSLQTTLCFSAFTMPLGNDDAQEELSKVTERLSLLSLVHQEVSRASGGAAVDLCEYLGHLAKSVHAAIGNPHVKLTVSCESAKLSKRRATAIGTIVDELLTAALTQRFPQERAGAIHIESRPLPDARIEVSIRDEGLNEAGAPPRSNASYERQMLERLTAHAKATIRYEIGAGTRSVIVLDPE